MKMNEEIKKKISLANTGKKRTIEQRKRMSEACKGRIVWNKGKTGIFSEQTLKKMSEAKKNQKHSEETKRKISGSRIGRKHSEETKKKISEGNKNHKYSKERINKAKEQCKLMAKRRKGQNHSEEVKVKIRKGNKGKHFHHGIHNPNWKGGVSVEPYCFDWGDKEFKSFIKERDDNECQNPDCSGQYKKLTIHHIDYIKKNCELNNLITLCVQCNSKANFNRQKHKIFYQRIMNVK